MISPLALAGIWTPGFWEIVLIFGAVLVIFGPKNIPALARSLGQGLREFKSASTKLTDAIDEAAREDDRQKAAAAPARQIPPPAPAETIATASQAAPLKEGH